MAAGFLWCGGLAELPIIALVAKPLIPLRAAPVMAKHTRGNAEHWHPGGLTEEAGRGTIIRQQRESMI